MKVAVIPARGGSKRIPGKNIREFAGKPMIAHSIECALASGVFDRVIVSTDDQRIADISRRYGAEVPFTRPAELADDHAVTSAVIAHAIKFLQANGVGISAVCCIYATAPFLSEQDIRAGLDILEGSNWQFVFSAAAFTAPVARAFVEMPGGGLRMLFPEHAGTRSQDLPEALYDAGQFYWGRPQAWLDGSAIFGEKSTVVRIPRCRVQDIDTEEDWAEANAMLANIRADSPGHSSPACPATEPGTHA